MQLKFNTNINKIINLIMIVLFCSFTILTSYSWGRYVMIGCVLVIFCMQILRDGGHYKLFVSAFCIIMVVFVLYTLMTAIWAENPNDSVRMARTLLEMVVMLFVLYNCYCGNAVGVNDLLRCIKWSSYIITVYSIVFYGIDYLLMAVESEIQIHNAYANINTIGMLAAVGVVIQVEEIIKNKKWKWEGVFCVPSVYMIAFTQSRKALLLLLIGIFLCFILHYLESPNPLKALGRIVTILIVLTFVFNILFSLPIFSGMMNRMNQLFASFTGNGKVDSSTLIRNQMIEIGWAQFLKTPFFGMGINNAHILSNEYLDKDAYLHNNYIELLAGGGIIGFVIYYSMYIYLFFWFWKLRRYKNSEYVICLVIMVLMLLMDYGMVSYYVKIRYIYLLVFFLEVESLRKNASNLHRS